VTDTRTILITAATDGLGRALASTTGCFFDRTHETRAHADAYDPEIRNRLWQLSLELTDAPDVP
jgi:NAD(P)-dependent dehydrogenase (short-subunit alcohol dehydrogenase family)